MPTGDWHLGGDDSARIGTSGEDVVRMQPAPVPPPEVPDSDTAAGSITAP